MKKITDPRIGIKDENGYVTKRPEQYATGGFWNRNNINAPTTVYFGENRRYFYILPIGIGKVSPELRRELLEIVGATETIREYVAANTSYKPVTKEKSEAKPKRVTERKVKTSDEIKAKNQVSEENDDNPDTSDNSEQVNETSDE